MIKSIAPEDKTSAGGRLPSLDLPDNYIARDLIKLGLLRNGPGFIQDSSFIFNHLFIYYF